MGASGVVLSFDGGRAMGDVELYCWAVGGISLPPSPACVCGVHWNRRWDGALAILREGERERKKKEPLRCPAHSNRVGEHTGITPDYFYKLSLPEDDGRMQNY